MAIHILGIRHHGVGSAKHVQARLQELRPDIILVEAPSEMDEVMHHIGKEDLLPPVAVMIYNEDDSKDSVFYPFAEYSPEWVAIKYGNQEKIPVRSFDLPSRVSFLKNHEELEETFSEPRKYTEDPLTIIAKTAGFKTGESFWEHHFEHGNDDSAQHFEKVMHLMQSLREEGLESSLDQENIDREAFMRFKIQEALNEMHTNIVIVCGAWHAPALVDIDSYQKEDAKLLKKLPKKKLPIKATWIPWTNGRLSMYSGYGAGIVSPGWYQHMWSYSKDLEINWLQKAAAVFRKEGVDTSTAHVIEAYRLACSLAQIRNKHLVTLNEMDDAILSVMCMGDTLLLELVNRHIVVGEAMGKIPEDVPKMPLQADFEKLIKTLRLKLSAAPKQYDLDLRKDIDRERSVFFHRLEILGFPWVHRAVSRTKGTFKESWYLKWSPEMMINLVDKAFLGNTVELASQQLILKELSETSQINDVAQLIHRCIPADLFEEINTLLQKINSLSNISTDIMDLIKTVPQLVEIVRYGDVRNTDLNVIDTIIRQLLIKINLGLANACYGLDDDNSVLMFEGISTLHQSIKIFSQAEVEEEWLQAISKILEKEGVHAIIYGCTCRLLLDANVFSEEAADTHVSLALSIANNPQEVAYWIEGFLKGSGVILLYDNRLWNLLYGWVEALPREVFMELLPMLRRSFSKFEYGERKQIGEKAKKGTSQESNSNQVQDDSEFDHEQAEKIIPIINQFLNPQAI